MITVLFTWHAAVLAANQKYLQHMAADPELAITLLIPPRWDESTAMVDACLPVDAPYRVRVDQVKRACKGLSFRYKNIRATLQEVQPDVIFLYEEPYSYVAMQMMYWQRKICPQAKFIFYTWQNLDCRYSFLRRKIESYVFRHSDLAIAGSQDVETVLRQRGFAKEIRRIPLAIDPADFPAATDDADRSELRRSLALNSFTIGYIGRLAQEKGLADLLHALSLLKDRSWQLLLIGSGTDAVELRQLAVQLQINERICWIPYVKNTEMYRYYALMDVFVLPSRTTAAWKEQFGRVLIESMICGAPVIGSSSGEIPLVIDEAGLVFPEGDAVALADRIKRLMNEPGLHRLLHDKGRERVLAHYTWEKVGQATAEIVREVSGRC